MTVLAPSTVRISTAQMLRNLRLNQGGPDGIAVDGSRSKLYWTNSRGRVQSANLDGSGITNVVSGLGSPGELVLSNSIAAPAGAGSSAGSGKTASGSKYDVNGDGTVDIGDSDALTIALAANSTDAKYDVNGNGKVDIFDLVEVRANIDPGCSWCADTLWHEAECCSDRSPPRTDRSVDCDERSFTGSDADAGIPAAASRDGTSRENAVACELSESVQPRNVDSL